MIDSILKLNGAKMYEVYNFEEIKNATTGAKGKEYKYLTQVYAFIQPTGSRGSVKGIMLEDTEKSGDRKIADYFMYHKTKRHEKERILYNNVFYEIRSIEYYDNGYLKFYKSYLVKVDNQNDKPSQR